MAVQGPAKKLQPDGMSHRGGSGGVPRRAANSNLIFPQPIFGSRSFLGVGGWVSEPTRTSPPLTSKAGGAQRGTHRPTRAPWESSAFLRATAGVISAFFGIGDPGQGARKGPQRRHLSAGPSLAPCTLRVRLGGRHSGSATSCFCADPCTHSVQDLNRLTCFCNFWNRGIWRFHFRWSMKITFFR